MSTSVANLPRKPEDRANFCLRWGFCGGCLESSSPGKPNVRAVIRKRYFQLYWDDSETSKRRRARSTTKRRSASDAAPQAAISERLRPQPVHHSPAGSSRHILIQGDATGSVISISRNYSERLYRTRPAVLTNSHEGKASLGHQICLFGMPVPPPGSNRDLH